LACDDDDDDVLKWCRGTRDRSDEWQNSHFYTQWSLERGRPTSVIVFVPVVYVASAVLFAWE